MRNLNIFLLFILFFSRSGCNTAPNASESEQIGSREAQETGPEGSRNTPELREVGSRGFFALVGPFAEFDPNHPSVEIWTPSGSKKAPIMVYAHGGAGYEGILNLVEIGE